MNEGMSVTLIGSDRCYSVTLPQKVAGRYGISAYDATGRPYELLAFEGVAGSWMACSTKHACVLDAWGASIDRVKLDPASRLIAVRVRNEWAGWESCVAYVEPLSDGQQRFERLIVEDGASLEIGRESACDISIALNLVSSRHAVLEYQDGRWSIFDCNSTNHTYVNDVSLEPSCRYDLNPGDNIYIMGVHILLGNGFLAINNPDGIVSLSDQLVPMAVEPPAEDRTDGFADRDEDAERYFYRSPRFIRTVEPLEISVDAPPTMASEDDTPILLVVGPAITMGFAAVVSGAAMVLNTLSNGGSLMQAAPMLAMSISMILGMALWPGLSRRFQRRQREKQEVLRQDRYRAYLDAVRERIMREGAHQTEILRENIIPVERCINRIQTRARSLWERTSDHDDFLTVRLGVGAVDLEANIRFPDHHFSLEEDSLDEALRMLEAEPRKLQEVPVSLSLVKDRVYGLIGSRSLVLPFARGIVTQLAALHSYDDLKLVFLLDEGELEQWEFARWLPHTWSNDRSVRYFATTIEEARELSLVLERTIAERREGKAVFGMRECTPYYVIVAASRTIAEKTEFVGSVVQSDQNYGFSLLALYDELRFLPKECGSVIELGAVQSNAEGPGTGELESAAIMAAEGPEEDDSKGVLYDRNDTTGASTAFVPDVTVDRSIADMVARTLANIRLDLTSQRFTLPTSLAFLEMFNVGMTEHLNAAARWQENNPSVSLQTPVGVDSNGDTFYLNLHEKNHGPHGLVAGMTGSGKSEFIITYILSLAVNFHPDEVSFILIDYKGGGLAGAFDNERARLPHLAGTITNLDGPAIHRSLVSIQSELRRRQAIFNRARDASNSGTMDIYRYQRLYRDGIVQEPIPHLFIISDEFAELKAQQPEFMEQLISTARIGRSLGVHLILATQKPAGVVNDQIWSNSKFKVCFKVQDKADSMDVIRRPDAASLVETGRFYFQVGFNEFFAEGQSAWCGAPYLPSETAAKKRDDSVRVIDHVGNLVAEARPAAARANATAKRQVVSVVDYLSRVAADEGAHAKGLWLPPLPEMLYVDELELKYGRDLLGRTGLFGVVGEIDDPENQSQRPLVLSLDEGGLIVYGAAGSGKFTFVSALLYSLIRRRSPEELNVYIADFGAETFSAFRGTPHVGDVVLANETEKVVNLFKMLREELSRRRKLFAAWGGSIDLYRREGGEPIPDIVVVIHGMAGFYELFEKLEGQLNALTREGTKFGIHFILTSASANTVRFRLAQNFRQQVALRMNDAAEYTAVLGFQPAVVPARMRGRGLVVEGKRALEFQTAHPGASNPDVFSFIRMFSASLEQMAGARAPRIPILPDRVGAAFFQGSLGDLAAFPVGVARRDLSQATVDLTQTPISFALSSDRDRLNVFTVELARALADGGHDPVVLDPDGSLDGLDGVRRIVGQAECADQLARIALEGSQLAGKVYIACSPMATLSALDAPKQRLFREYLEKVPVKQAPRLVFSETVLELNPFRYETWLQRSLANASGVWVGDGIAEQTVLKPGRIEAEMYQDVPAAFGYVLTKGKPVLAKLYSSEEAY